MNEIITWIPVGDRLPENSRDVLVYCPREDAEVWLGYYDAGQWDWADASVVRGEITHWAELPDGPKLDEVTP